MVSAFDAFDASVQQAMTATFGEPVTLIPYNVSQYGGAVADPARQLRPPVKGVFSEAPEMNSAYGQGTGSRVTSHTSFGAGGAELWLDPTSYAGLGYSLRKGDGVRLTARAGTPTYTISRVAFNSSGDVIISLTNEPPP